uniref:Uncharacterized protein n=1 Tax=Arundo donax TaxID=35708 RepID=A0A0A8ZEY0_ARUDO
MCSDEMPCITFTFLRNEFGCLFSKDPQVFFFCFLAYGQFILSANALHISSVWCI